MPKAIPKIASLNFDLREIAELAAATPDCLRSDLGQIKYPRDARLLSLMKEQAEKEDFAYAPTLGAPDLIEAIRRFDHRALRHFRDVATLVTSGGQAALYASFKTFLEPGDIILTDLAAYPPYGRIAKLLGTELLKMDLEQLPEIDPRFSKVKILLLNSPHNPTGKIHSPEVLQRLAKLAEEYDWLVFDDAVYDRIYYQLPPESISRYCSGRTLIIQSASKNLALPGIRIGWISGERAHIMEIAKVHRNMNSCPNSFFQHVLAEYLEYAMPFVQKMREEMQRRKALMCAIMDRLSWEYSHPEGGIYLWTKPSFSGRSESFVRSLIQEVGISAIPGNLFGRHPHHIRFCFGALDLREIHDFSQRLEVFCHV